MLSCDRDPAKAESPIPSSASLLIKLSTQNMLLYLIIPLLKYHVLAVFSKCIPIYSFPLPVGKFLAFGDIFVFFYSGAAAADKGGCCLLCSDFSLSL